MTGNTAHIRGVSTGDVEPIPVGVIGAASLDTDSAQKPERTPVREDFEHCPGSKWQMK
ncbi:hypothetical protein [Pectobacterium parmentieri]|uniref:hypothetical protein n=1 Tax=Pectobacterium parmentieri TaxID=1905730 RepID=UPI0002FB270B|nr:hypothetical protein [Pectobacterium parmentieri]